jgi:hypothetical protein
MPIPRLNTLLLKTSPNHQVAYRILSDKELKTNPRDHVVFIKTSKKADYGYQFCRDISSRQNKQRHVVRNPAKLRLPPHGFRGIGRGLGTSIYLHESIYFLLWSIHAVHLTVYTVPSW